MASQPQTRDQLRNQASQVADQVTTTASQATESVKQTILEQAGTRLDGVAQQVNSVGEVLHQTAQQLRDKQQPVLASQTDQLASRAQTISQHLRDSSPQDLLREAEDYTRSQPAMVLGAAAILGFAVARLLKVGGSRTMASQNTMNTRMPSVRQTGAGAPPALPSPATASSVGASTATTRRASTPGSSVRRAS
jgi:ElaB/YqjD/DUF883 family membrane-anchored ribosome-binding protein